MPPLLYLTASSEARLYVLGSLGILLNFAVPSTIPVESFEDFVDSCYRLMLLDAGGDFESWASSVIEKYGNQVVELLVVTSREFKPKVGRLVKLVNKSAREGEAMYVTDITQLSEVGGGIAILRIFSPELILAAARANAEAVVVPLDDVFERDVVLVVEGEEVKCVSLAEYVSEIQRRKGSVLELPDLELGLLLQAYDRLLRLAEGSEEERRDARVGFSVIELFKLYRIC